MFCNNCGAQNPDGANNCSNCGASLNNTQQTSQPAAPVQNNAPVQPVTPVQPQKPKNNKGLIIGIVAGVVALIAIVAVVLVFVLGGDKDKDDEKDGSSTTKAAVTQDAGDKDNKDNNSNDKPATSNMSYQDVFKEYLKLASSGDFSGALKYSAIDVDGFVTDIVNSQGKSMSELYDVLEGMIYDASGEEVEITSLDQFYTVMGQMFSMGQMFGEEIGNYTITDVKITECDLLNVTDSDDMDDIEDRFFSYYALWADICWGFGHNENGFPIYLDISKYVDTSKITEAYKIEYFTITFSDGTSETDDDGWYVINYNGNWLVVGEPMYDML